MTKEDSAHIRINDKIITINQHGLFGKYLKFCTYGFTSGLVIGAYTGGAVGLGVTALTPAVLCYGIFKYGRKLLRK
jgi:hypothetical protein